MRYVNFMETKVYLHPAGDVACDNILKGQFFEEHLVHFFNKIIKDDSIIIEGGAHIGIHTIRFSKLAPNGHVYSFEASKRNFDLVNKTIVENNITNVTIKNNALYSENKLVYLSEHQHPDQDSVNTKFGTPIQAVTIDSLNLPNIDFIKLDVEGAELDVLKGAQNVIKTLRPTIAFEFLNHRTDIESPIPFLITNEYDVYNIDTHWDYIAIPKEKEVFNEE